MLHGRPPPRVQPDLAADRQRRRLVKALNGGEVDPRHPLQSAAHVETRSVARSLPRPQHWQHRLTVMTLGERPKERFDRRLHSPIFW
jgi:hypothetical protein